ncbi:hypothetical protein K438DRAFT_1758160 [Mycena galopus ATCC 62051]|nr:hypothetical protein K438DRAFT_1758160 [Mycena galopus ATCC 62051]
MTTFIFGFGELNPVRSNAILAWLTVASMQRELDPISSWGVILDKPDFKILTGRDPRGFKTQNLQANRAGGEKERKIPHFGSRESNPVGRQLDTPDVRIAAVHQAPDLIANRCRFFSRKDVAILGGWRFPVGRILDGSPVKSGESNPIRRQLDRATVVRITVHQIRFLAVVQFSLKSGQFFHARMEIWVQNFRIKAEENGKSIYTEFI